MQGMTPSSPTGTDNRGFSLRNHMVIAASLVFVLFAIVVVWAGTARLSGAVIVQGSVAVDKNLKVIQHRDGGIVGEILVSTGDYVDEGQVLIRLDDAQTKAELSIVKGQLGELRVRKARLEAEREGLESLVFPADLEADNTLADIVAGERRIFNGNLAARESRVKQLRLGVAQIQEEIRGLNAQLDSKDKEITLVADERAKLKGLHERQLIPTDRYYTTQREHARLDGERGEILASVARAKSRISELKLQILSVEDGARTDAQRELAQVETKLSELDDRWYAIEDTLSRTDIRAPVSGHINELHVSSVGGVITSAQVLASIVPQGAHLKIESKIPPVSIEQVAPGQQARLRFTAFNQRTTPEIPGEVTFVSPAAAKDEDLGGLFYNADIAFDPTELAALSEEGLRPGMPVEVYISTDERTALSYLMKPFTDQFSRAMRER